MKTSKILIIIIIASVLGSAWYILTKQKTTPLPEPKINKIEISSDGKSILNADTKEVVLAIEGAKAYLEVSGYAYNPDTFQNTDAKYAGDCFLDAALSNKKDRIVFSTRCLPGDLPQAWIGTDKLTQDDSADSCSLDEKCAESTVKLLIGGGGNNFVWSEDDKNVAYEAILGLSGMTEKRTIDSQTGEILQKGTASACPSTVKDIDNNIYNTVLISDQCWFKENLKVTKNPSGTAITRHCYNNNLNICKTDGGLYDWSTAMNNSIQDGAQGICPNGWHIPEDSEWYTLESGLTIGSCDANRNGSGCYIGTKLKNSGANGFEALAAGRYSSDGSFGFRSKVGFFWSSTKNNTFAWYRFLYLSDDSSEFQGEIDRLLGAKDAGFSIRCIKN